MVAPKKAKLAEAETEFAELMVGLNAKKAELKAVEERLAALNAKLEEMQAREGEGREDWPGAVLVGPSISLLPLACTLFRPSRLTRLFTYSLSHYEYS